MLFIDLYEPIIVLHKAQAQVVHRLSGGNGNDWVEETRLNRALFLHFV